jgi:hypothetical protein
VLLILASKLAPDVIDIFAVIYMDHGNNGGKLPPSLTTPLTNLPPVSMPPVIKFAAVINYFSGQQLQQYQIADTLY